MSASMILPLALRAHAASAPDSTAVVDPGRTWTFAALDAHADALAGGLVAAGVGPGDRLVLLAAPSARAVALLAAAGRIGACVAPLGTSLAAPELAAAGVVIGPRLAVHDAEHLEGARALGVPTALLEALGAGVAGAGVPPTAFDLDPTVPAVAILTSGTTGRPKAALLSQASMSASAAAWTAALPEATGWVLCLGLAHVAGLGVAWRAIGAGVPLRVIPEFEVSLVLDALSQWPASHVSLVPTQLARLLDAAAAEAWRPGQANLRAVLLGGAPIPPELVTRALATGWPVVPTYGLTEAGSGVSALATGDAVAHPGSAGRPLPGVGIRIADPAADGTGEIQVRTTAAFSGYLGRPDATAAAFEADGWLRTGDAGRIDADGFLHVLVRRDDLIVSGGENVFPAEVEAVLAAHPGIAEAGVAGRPDPAWGAVPVAWVVPRPGAPVPVDTELRDHCRARLAPYKVPVDFIVVASLSRTASGKLRRSELRAALADPVPAAPPRAGDASSRDVATLDVASSSDEASSHNDGPLHDGLPQEDVSA